MNFTWLWNRIKQVFLREARQAVPSQARRHLDSIRRINNQLGPKP